MYLISVKLYQLLKNSFGHTIYVIYREELFKYVGITVEKHKIATRPTFTEQFWLHIFFLDGKMINKIFRMMILKNILYKYISICTVVSILAILNKILYVFVFYFTTVICLLLAHRLNGQQ